jgi:predicted RNA-binding Zn-ribbon protein involved in translation (DUF1610 family)
MIEISVKLTCDKCGLVMPKNTGKTRSFMSNRLLMRVINYDENWFLGTLKEDRSKTRVFCPECIPESIQEQRQLRKLVSHPHQ